MNNESSPGATGPPLPLSSLRLLVPPLRLVSAWMWQVAEQQNIMHYGKLEEFVTLVTEMVPDLLSYKWRAQLILGLRARLVLELCRDESPADFQTIQPHLDRISQSAEPHGGKRDPEVEAAQGNFIELIQTLLKNTEDRKHFFQAVFPEQYGPKYDTALQILVWEFLSRLEQLLPVPDFKQTASWLGGDVSSVLDDSLQSVSNPEYLNDLLQHHQCLDHFEKGRSCDPLLGDTILSTLSCPSSIRAVIALNKKTSSASAHLHTCSQCGKSFNFPSKLKEHVRIHTGERPFNCIKCGKNFITSWDLTRHQRFHYRTHKTKIKSHVCSECGKSFRSSLHLKRHERSHTREGINCETNFKTTKHHKMYKTKSHSCSQCGKNFRDKLDLRKHQTTHTEAGPFSCIECGKSCKSACILKNHQKIHSIHETKSHSCSQCGKSFRDATDLRRHQITHTEERPFSCKECGKSYKYAYYFKIHQRIHSGEQPHLCSYCGKSFNRHNVLESHLRTHTGERPYSCSHCGKTFIQGNMLTRHMRMHTGERPYLCQTCGKSFLSSGELLRHTRTHTGERPYRCAQCGKSFRVLGSLQLHRQIHTGERPHPCPQCRKRFYSNSDLVRHIRVHTGEKPYQCSLCGKRFADSSNMNRHQRVHRQAEML